MKKHILIAGLGLLLLISGGYIAYSPLMAQAVTSPAHLCITKMASIRTATVDSYCMYQEEASGDPNTTCDTSPVGISEISRMSGSLTIRNLHARLPNSGSLGSCDWTYTLYKNGSPTDIGCTMANDATSCSDIDALKIKEGDELYWFFDEDGDCAEEPSMVLNWCEGS